MSGARKAAMAVAKKWGQEGQAGAPHPVRGNTGRWAGITGILFNPLKVLRIRFDEEYRPSSMTVFAGAILLYFIVVSGVIYDYLKEVPSLGHARDPQTGVFRSEVFMSGRINGQYIIEGLAAGFLFMLGGAGFILLEMSHSAQGGSARDNQKSLLTLSGLLCVLISFSLLQAFTRIKIPQYLSSS